MHTLTRVIPVLWGLLFAAIVQASPIVDQQHIPSGNFPALTVARDRTQIQTFTVGITGTLTRIDVQVSKASQTVEDLVLSLWSTDAAGLPQTRLATASVAPTDPAFTIPGPGDAARPLIPFDLTAGAVEVTAGEVLAIVLNSNAANDPPPFDERYTWEIGGQYDRGTAYTQIGSSIFAQSEDFHFRTFMEPCVGNFGPCILECIRVGLFFDIGSCIRRCTADFENCLQPAVNADLVPLDDQGNPPMGQSPVRYCQGDASGNLIVTVENQGGTSSALPPSVQVTFFPGGTRDMSCMSVLAPDQTCVLHFPIPSSCFNPDCGFLIQVEPDINEGPNTGNNVAHGTCIG